jgi:diguanylate cyclase (GGDEF)-like protein
VAACLPRVVRPSDVAGRWGGDEFVVLVDDVEARHLEELGHRLRREIAISVDVGRSVVLPSLSIGSTIAQAGEAPDQVLERADAAMYARKRRRGTPR